MEDDNNNVTWFIYVFLASIESVLICLPHFFVYYFFQSLLVATRHAQRRRPDGTNTIWRPGNRSCRFENYRWGFLICFPFSFVEWFELLFRHLSHCKKCHRDTRYVYVLYHLKATPIFGVCVWNAMAVRDSTVLFYRFSFFFFFIFIRWNENCCIEYDRITDGTRLWSRH